MFSSRRKRQAGGRIQDKVYLPNGRGTRLETGQPQGQGVQRLLRVPFFWLGRAKCGSHSLSLSAICEPGPG